MTRTSVAPAAALVLLAAGAAAGQSVRLPEELKAEPGTLVVLRAETDCPALQWLVLDPGLTLIPSELLKDSKTAVGLAGRAGAFRVLAYGARGDAASPPAVVRVVVGTPTPPPPPGPAPPAAGLSVTVVTDAERMDAGVAELLRSPGLRQALGDGGHQLRLFDVTSGVLDRQGLRPLVNSVGVPALIVQQPSGQVIRGLRVPDTVPAFLDACRP